MNPLVMVVVPTYNEAENLPELARRIFALDLPNVKMIVVDDGSPDGTGDVARGLAREHRGRVEVIQRGRKLGLGTAYVAGFKKALEEDVDFVVQMDADLSHTPETIPALLDALTDSEVVVGSRYVEGGGSASEWGISRRILSFLGNFGIRTIVGLGVRDSTSGFKAFRAGALRSLDLAQLRCKGFAFQAEVAQTCERRGYIVVEHPINFEIRAQGRSKMSLGIVLEAIRCLLPLRWTRRE